MRLSHVLRSAAATSSRVWHTASSLPLVQQAPLAPARAPSHSHSLPLPHPPSGSPSPPRCSAAVPHSLSTSLRRPSRHTEEESPLEAHGQSLPRGQGEALASARPLLASETDGRRTDGQCPRNETMTPAGAGPVAQPPLARAAPSIRETTTTWRGDARGDLPRHATAGAHPGQLDPSRTPSGRISFRDSLDPRLHPRLSLKETEQPRACVAPGCPVPDRATPGHVSFRGTALPCPSAHHVAQRMGSTAGGPLVYRWYSRDSKDSRAAAGKVTSGREGAASAPTGAGGEDSSAAVPERLDSEEGSSLESLAEDGVEEFDEFFEEGLLTEDNAAEAALNAVDYVIGDDDVIGADEEEIDDDKEEMDGKLFQEMMRSAPEEEDDNYDDEDDSGGEGLDMLVPMGIQLAGAPKRVQRFMIQKLLKVKPTQPASMSMLRKKFQMRIVDINRTAKVTRGGKVISFGALVVCGNSNGVVGFGRGKSAEVGAAVDKAFARSLRNLHYFERYRGRTVSAAQVAKYGKTKVYLWPAKKGSTMSAGSTVGGILRLAGFSAVKTKVIGSRNPINTVKATFKALGLIDSQSRTAQVAAVA